jgi:hypothetical protein
MNLRNLFEIHSAQKTLPDILEGVEHSLFIEKHIELHTLVRNVLNALLQDTLKNNFHQNQNGGLAIKSAKDIEKKQSFCTDFNQIIDNALALIGSEFCKYLFYLFGIKQLINQTLKRLELSISYSELLENVKYINNLTQLSSSLGENREKNVLDYYAKLIEELQEKIFIRNIVNYESDKKHILGMLSKTIEEFIPAKYIIKSVDELVLNLGPFNIGYDESFIKCFEILYKESFADIPYELWYLRKPYQDFIATLNIESCSPYRPALVQYFKNIFLQTLNSYKELSDTFLSIEVTNEFYDLLVDITLNLFVNVAKNLALSQMSGMCFGKGTRIQFIQIYSAFLACSPRLKNFTKSQISTLHYFLLTTSTLMNSKQIYDSEMVCSSNVNKK